jgi:hypothetical protein
MATMTAIDWRDRPLADLKLPKRTLKHLTERATMPDGSGVEDVGDVWDAIEEAHDLGLGELQERVRGQIEAWRTEQAAEDEADALPRPSLNGKHDAPKAAARLPDREEAWARIRECEQRVAAAENIALNLKKRASAAKAEFDSCVSELRQAVREANTPQAPTLFDGDASQPAAPESWQDFPLSRWDAFGLNASIIDTLGEQGISTVGDLQDYTKPNDAGYCKKLTDLNGIGAGKAQKIEDAGIQFWAAWEKDLRAEWEAEQADTVLAEAPDGE